MSNATPMAVERAVEVIGNRRSDTGLVKRVRAFLGNDLPELFEAEDRVPVCIAPHVAGGTKAELLFAEAVGDTDGLPVWTSYVEDRFSTRNPAKVNHLRPKIAWPKGQVTKQWIVSKNTRSQPNIEVGTASTIFSDERGSVLTVADYQNNLTELALQCADISLDRTVIDYSDWYTRQSELRGEQRSASSYYPAVMALYSVFGVLFRYDNQPGNEDVVTFRRSVAGPAAEYTFNELGVEPVIVAQNYPSGGEVTELTNIDTAAPKIVEALQRVKVGDSNENSKRD